MSDRRPVMSLRRSRAAGRILVVALVVVTSSLQAQTTDAPSRIERLEREVQALRESLAALRAAPRAPIEADGERLEEVERRIDLLAEELEQMRLGRTVARADRQEHGMGPAASKVYRVEDGLSLGGYGEMLFQGFDSRTDDGSPAGLDDRLDFQRAILYVGYKFGDRWLFNSEIEYEHASTEDEGAVSVEFAYLDYLWRPSLNVRAGLVLVPMGLVNELHEPTVFLGARRPLTERLILPSTWRENGFGLFGTAGPLSYRTYVLTGLRAEGFTAGGLRGGRQSGSKSVAEDFAWVGRLDYTPRPGLTLGGSLYLGDSGQGLEDASGGIGVRTTLYEGHLDWRWRGVSVRALAARAELDDVSRLNGALGLAGAASVGERGGGFYVEAGYDLFAHRPEATAQLTPFVRWEEVDTQDAVPSGFERDPASDQRVLTLGLDFKPIPQLVFKLDYQDVRNGAGTGVDQLNVAVGYIF